MRVGRNLLRGKIRRRPQKVREKRKREKKLFVNIVEEKGLEEKNCWKLHPEKRPKYNNNKGKQKNETTTQHDLGEDSSDESKITVIGLKNMKGKKLKKNPILVHQTVTYKLQMKKRELNCFM